MTTPSIKNYEHVRPVTLRPVLIALDRGFQGESNHDELFSRFAKDNNYFPAFLTDWYKVNFKSKISGGDSHYVDFYARHFLERMDADRELFKGDKRYCFYTGESLTVDKHSALIVYAYCIINPGSMSSSTSDFINRLMLIDLFSQNKRTAYILKHLPSLGCTQQQTDAAIDSLLSKCGSLFRKNDAELSAVVAGHDVLLDALLKQSTLTRLQLQERLLDGLDKKTISPQTFPAMAKLIDCLIGSLDGGSYHKLIDGRRSLLFHNVAKMAAKPKYMDSRCLEPLLLKMMAEYQDPLSLDSLFFAAKALRASGETIDAIKANPCYVKALSKDPVGLARSFMKAFKTGGDAYQLAVAMEIPLSDAQLRSIKTKTVKTDFGL